MRPTPRLLGERLCLDFANTVDPRRGDHPRDFLTDYADLARWARRAGVLPARDVDALLDEAERHPGKARAAFRSARDLREQLHRIFSSVAAASAPDPSDLQAVAGVHAVAMTHARLIRRDGGYRWGWDEERGRLDRVVWSVARDAADLLTTGRLDRLRECPGPDGCGWLFYDTSRNGRRRWCSMEGCGNRAKGRRYYDRHFRVSAR
jgi:predicted RNA-binding Zn ribbon-like protein